MSSGCRAGKNRLDNKSVDIPRSSGGGRQVKYGGNVPRRLLVANQNASLEDAMGDAQQDVKNV